MTGFEGRKLKRGLTCAALLSVALGVGAARAEPSAADRATARELMAQGRSARKAGDHKTALGRFQAADDLMHFPTTGLELAREQIECALLVEASGTLLKVIRHPVEKGEPAPFASARKSALELNDQLKPRIPSITIRVQATPPDTVFRVTIDNNEVPNSALGLARSVNPGRHDVVAVAGQKSVRAEVEVKEGQSEQVTLELVVETAVVAPSASVAPPPSHSAPAPTTPPTTPLPPPTAPAKSGVGPTLVVAGLVTSGVGILLGGITGGLSLSKTKAVEKDCVDKRCPPSTHDDIDSARTLATLSNIGFIVAGAGAAVTITGLLIGSPSQRTPTQGILLQPYVSYGGAGVRGEF